MNGFCEARGECPVYSEIIEARKFGLPLDPRRIMQYDNSCRRNEGEGCRELVYQRYFENRLNEAIA